MPCCSHCVFIEAHSNKFVNCWLWGNVFPGVWLVNIVLYLRTLLMGPSHPSDDRQRHHRVIDRWHRLMGWLVTNIAVWGVLCTMMVAIFQLEGVGQLDTDTNAIDT